MFVPESYLAALVLMLLSMLCWGSWANTLKLCPGYRFQLFYWDYAVGVMTAALVLGLTLGSHGHTGHAMLASIVEAPSHSLWLAAAGGVVFNIANLLLVAAIDIAGLAVAFPIGIGLALIVGSIWSYTIAPAGNPLLLFGGIALVTVAIVLDAAAYRAREKSAPAATTRGIALSLISGVLMGSFYPLVAKAMTPKSGAVSMSPYATATLFAFGVLLSTIPANALLMWKPLDGKPAVSFKGYWDGMNRWHLAGVLGGAIWCLGAICNFLGSGAHKVGPAVSYSIGQGATMISAFWGVFVWHEFAGAPAAARRYLALMFAFFLVGLAAIAIAPLF